MADEYNPFVTHGERRYGEEAAAAGQAAMPATGTAQHANHAGPPSYDTNKWKSKSDGGAYDRQLAERLIAYYAQTKGRNNPVVQQLLGNPHALATVMRKSGESYNGWLQRLNAHFPGIAYQSTTGQWRDAGGVIENDPEAMAYINFDSQLGEDGLTQSEREKAGQRKQMEEFMQALLKPFDPNDPEVKHIMTMAGNRASDQARLQGVQGPAGLTDMQASMHKTGLGYVQQRHQLGLQAMQYKDQHELAQGQLAHQKLQDQYQGWGDKAGLAEAYKPAQNGGAMGSGIGGAVGGGLGMAIGSIIPGIGTALGGMIGSGLGSGLGGAIGSAGQSNQPFQYSQDKYRGL